MKKKISLAIASLLTAVSFTPVLSACEFDFANFDLLSLFGINSHFRGEVLEQDEVRVNVRDGKCYVRWKKVDGASGYNLYRSESRFGKYTLVNNEEALKKTNYETETATYYYYKVTALVNGKEVEVGDPVSAFSENSLIISPSDDMTKVQAYIDGMHDQLESGSTGQFSNERFAMMFLPGKYPEIEAKTGYYTSVIGLGEVPTDVTVNSLYVSTNVLSNNNSTCTFWRGVENITFDTDTQWAVSQATSMRRVQINGDLALSHPTGYSSGGFLANSKVAGTVNPGTQQQWMSRNDEWGSWLNNGGSHNLVFAGCEGDTPADAWSDSKGRYTNIETSERIAEKPFLINTAANDYKVFVPDVEKNTKGYTWENGIEKENGVFIDLDDFYLADAKVDDDETLNAALKAGKHLLLTPGQYMLDEPLVIEEEDTVVMGMGYATLMISDKNSKGAIQVGDVGGVRLAELLIDAGDYCKNMVVVGSEGSEKSYADNPVVMSNIYLRIGGVENKHTETDTAMVINSNDTIGDNFWIWRADHSQGVAWEDTENEDGSISYGNPCQTGIRVNGDNVLCYALMVEHFENYQTYWAGENGKTIMYQSETPYRVPTQEHWMSKYGTKRGCASYKVDDNVNTHTAYGIGVYLVSWTEAQLDSAIEVPEKEGVQMIHLVTCSFAGDYTTINNVINNVGGSVGRGTFRKLVEKYPVDD